MPLTGILLAAGSGVRFGGGKLMARLPDSVPVGVAACRNLVAAIPRTVAVVRAGDAELAGALRATGARVVEFDGAARGMGASLAFAVASADDAQGWIVALADMPWIAPATIGRVAQSLEAGAALAAPFVDGKRGHPVGFGIALREALLGLDGDEGARDVVARHADRLQRIVVDDRGILRDVDTPADLSST